MKSSIVLQGLAAVCIAATASAVLGQNAIQLFSPANVRVSTQGTGYGNQAITFNNTNLSLTCPASITAKLSSSSSGTGNVLVDNYISLGIGGGTSTDICRGGNVENGNQQNCFTSSYGNAASDGTATGQDPDVFLPSGGVGPIDISGRLQPGANQVKIGLVDTGYYLASSTLYLVTNCTPNGVSGPGNVTGNPISNTNPSGSQLNQSYMFNSFNSQQVGFTYNLSEAQNSGQLSITDGTVPSTADITLDPANFQSTYLKGTSFATASCLIHTGELYNNAPACKLYTVTCQVGTNPAQSGVLCPTSQSPNEIFQDNFDGPAFTLPDLAGLHGGTFHTGVGFLEAKEKWIGGTCVFDSASAIAGELCPQNLLSTFSGPGAYESGGRGQSTNSTFITVYGVPEDLTTVTVAGLRPGNWINSHNASVKFVSTPPAVASSNNFIAAPIQSLTYGISLASSVPQPGPPVPLDITVDNTACPTPGQTYPPPATPFTTTDTVSVSQDGNYELHYFAQDCAGTKELKFTQIAGSWNTSFYTYPINVDTVKPVVTGPTLPSGSTTYSVGQKVLATFRCTDALSGIVQCGTSTWPSSPTPDTGNLTAYIDTSKTGPQTFTVTAVDAAGNMSSASVGYTVSGAPVNLVIVKLAPLLAKQGSTFSYAITVGNLSLQTASAVSITDTLPAGVSFVSASAGQLANSPKCSFAGNTVTCTTPSVTLVTPVAVQITVKAVGAVGMKVTNVANVSSANPQGPLGNSQSIPVTTLITK